MHTHVGRGTCVDMQGVLVRVGGERHRRDRPEEGEVGAHAARVDGGGGKPRDEHLCVYMHMPYT